MYAKLHRIINCRSQVCLVHVCHRHFSYEVSAVVRGRTKWCSEHATRRNAAQMCCGVATFGVALGFSLSTITLLVNPSVSNLWLMGSTLHLFMKLFSEYQFKCGLPLANIPSESASLFQLVRLLTSMQQYYMLTQWQPQLEIVMHDCCINQYMKLSTLVLLEIYLFHQQHYLFHLRCSILLRIFYTYQTDR